MQGVMRLLGLACFASMAVPSKVSGEAEKLPETVWKACQQFREEIKGKVVTFQIDNTTMVSYLWMEDGTHWEN